MIKSRRSVVPMLLLLGALVQGCSAGGGGETNTTNSGGGASVGGPGGGVCAPGKQELCPCVNSQQGVQVCAPDGSGYGACNCSGTGQGGASGVGGESQDGGSGGSAESELGADAFISGSEEGVETEIGGGTALQLEEGSCFGLPLEEYKIGGYKHGSVVKAGVLHAGDDVKASVGTPTFAIYDGKVRFAGKASTWGYLVEIEHTAPDGTSFISLYGHHGPGLAVVEGQEVSQGQLLGTIGNSAQNGGWPAHLHFSIFTGIHPTTGVLKGHVVNLKGYENPIPWMNTHGAGCDQPGSECQATLTAPTNNLSVQGSFQVIGTASDQDGLARVTLAINNQNVPLCDGDCGGTSFPINTTINPAELGFSGNQSLSVAVWTKDLKGNTCGPKATRTINWSKASTCGDGVCDGGESQSTCCKDCGCPEGNSCQANSCQASVLCGNGTKDTGEVCDGSDLGGQSCQGAGFDGGNLSCLGCQLNTAGCCKNECSYAGTQCQGDDVYSCASNGACKQQTFVKSCSNGCSNGDCTICVPNCGGKCGGAPDGCGGSCLGGCGSGQVCQNQSCTGCGNQGQPCCDSGLACQSALTCNGGSCQQQTCTANASPSGSTTVSMQTNCTCSSGNPGCHSLYKAQVANISSSGGLVYATISVSKGDNSTIKAGTKYRIAVTDASNAPACTFLSNYAVRVEGTFSSDSSSQTISNVPIWKDASDFANGASKHLFLITDGSTTPGQWTWFQPQPIVFTKTCN